MEKTNLSSVPNGQLWSRREFLQTLGLLGSALYSRLGFAAPHPGLPVVAEPAVCQIFRLQRPRDLLSLHLELINLRVVSRRGRYGREVHLASHGSLGYLVLHFPGQHLAEQAVWDRANLEGTKPGGGDAPTPLTYHLTNGDQALDQDLTFLKTDRIDAQSSPQGMAGVWLSGPSQIVFAVGELDAPFAFDVDTILRLCAERLPLVVAPQVQPRAPGAPTPTPPAAPNIWLGHHAVEDVVPFTAIEFPTLLYVSPYENARWRLRPLTGPRRSELWGFELQAPSAAQFGIPRELRAPGHLFAFAYGPVDEVNWPLPPASQVGMDATVKYGPTERPKTTLYEATRELLVAQLAEDNGDITAQRFRLSAPGGTARENYKPLFDPPGDEPGNGEGQIPETDDQRIQGLQSALSYFGFKLSDQQSAQIGVIVTTKRTLSRKDLFALFKPVLDSLGIASDSDQAKSIEQAFVNPGSIAVPRGLLSEWEQKTEVGRDFYTKESFAGFLMPFVFKAEAVTITERIPSTDKPAELVKIKGSDGKLALPGPDDVIEMGEQESSLVGFLVSRKFVRVKPWRDGTRKREFTSTESADFAPWLAESGRTAGLLSVEIRVERTPVLANKGVNALGLPNPTEELRQGRDYIVDQGSGKDAAREVFWPRVEGFTNDAQGNAQRILELYRFPVRLTYLDGTFEDTDLPMLFVPTEAQGRAFYPITPRSQRLAPVKNKVSLVTPPPSALITDRDLGSGTDLANYVQQHLATFIADPKIKQFAIDQAQEPANPKNPGALDSASNLGLLANSVNVFLDNLPNEIARRVTQFRERVYVEISKLTEVELLNWFKVRLGYEEDQVKYVLRTADLLAAWGMEEVGTVDAAAAADRMAQILRIPVTVTAQSIQPVENAIKTLRNQVQQLGDEFKDIKPGLLNRFDRLTNALSQTIGGDVSKYQQALRELLIDWTIRLTGIWRREMWDQIFAQCAHIIDPDNHAKVLTAVFHKEVYYKIIHGDKVIDLQIDDSGKALKITMPDFEGALGDAILPMRPDLKSAQLGSTFDALFDTLADLASRDIGALTRVLHGVEMAFGEERALRQRFHFLQEQFSRLKEADVRIVLKPLLGNLRAQVVFGSTHLSDGAERLRLFLSSALPAEEMEKHYEETILAQVEQFKLKVRQSVQKQIDEVQNKINENGLSQVQQAVERTLALTNPDRVRQKFEDIVDLSGRRIGQEIRDRIRRVQADAAHHFDALWQEVQNDSVTIQSQATAVMGNLAEMFAFADTLAGKERSLLRTVVSKADDLQAKLSDFLKVVELSQVPGLRRWIRRTIEIPEGLAVSPRMFVILDNFAEDLQRAADLQAGAVNRLTTAREQIKRQLIKDLRDVVQDGTTQVSGGIDEFRTLAGEVILLANSAVGELRARADALKGMVESAVIKETDRLDHLLLIMAAAPAEAETAVQGVINEFLKSILDSPVSAFLGNNWQRIQDTLGEVRRYVGEVSDFTQGLKGLDAEARREADGLLNNLRGYTKGLADALQKDLSNRCVAVEGDAFAMVKRALVALPSPTMLSGFADQTGKAIYEAREVIFNAAENLGEGLRSFGAFPALDGITVKLPGATDFSEINHTVEYLQNGLRDFDSAKGAIYAELKNGLQSLGDAAGISTVAAQVQALSREAGAVSDEFRQAAQNYVDQAREVEHELIGEYEDAKKAVTELLQSPNAQIKALFQALLGNPVPKLFGLIPLDLLLNACLNISGLPKTLPNNLPDRVETTQTLVTPIKDGVDFALLAFQPQDGEICELRLEGHTTMFLPQPGRSQQPPVISTRGQINHFTIVVGSVIGISFQSLTFVSENGSLKCTPKFGKGDQSGIMDALQFMGPLEFVQSFAESLMSMLTGKLPFLLDYQNGTIFAKIVIALPTLGFGAVAIENLTLRMGVGLPVESGRPLTFSFEISDRVETFKVSVCGFAGGGYFGLLMSSDPAQGSIDTAIEFGGALALNVGFAQGSLSVMAGIYFNKRGPEVQMNAYIRACGVVMVLGFIEISIVIYLSLSYDSGSGALAGEVSVSIRVKIGFFSKSFRLRYSTTIAGSKQAYLEHAAWEEDIFFAEREAPPLLASNGRLHTSWNLTSPDPTEATMAEIEIAAVRGAARKSKPSPPKAQKMRPNRQFTDVVNRQAWLAHWRRFARGRQAPDHGPLGSTATIYAID